MAKIYNQDGYVLTEGLQGCTVCSEAIQVAQSMARDRNEPVILEDDDGTWLVPVDGLATEIDAD
jgi:hypothetical protein